MKKATLLFFVFLIFLACKKEEEPTPENDTQQDLIIVNTTAVTQITAESANTGGEITYPGGYEEVDIHSKGVCWSLSDNPDTTDFKTNDAGGTIYYSVLNDLDPSTSYYVRAYVAYDTEIAYGEVISFTTEAPALAAGDDYKGGIIAYIFQPGDDGYVENETHGIIAAENDFNTNFPWGCEGTELSNANGEAIGTGMQNTLDIVAGCGDTSFAAKACADLNENGYSDWYLPSELELAQVYQNKNAIGGFSNTFYWTSTQANATNAVNIDFTNGYQYTVPGSKSDLKKVRAVRNF